MKYKLFLFPILFAVVAGVLATSYSEEADILFSIPAFFVSTIALVVYVATLSRMHYIAGQVLTSLVVKRIVSFFSAAAFIVSAVVGSVYTFGAMVSTLMLYIAIAGLVLSTALVWNPALKLRNHWLAVTLLFITVIALGVAGVHEAQKFDEQRDVLYGNTEGFKIATDCDIFTYSGLKAECLRSYAENTNGGVAVCPPKIDATSLQCYAVKASREQNYKICENDDFLKYYKKYPYEGWMESGNGEIDGQDGALRCKIELVTASVGEVDKEYYENLPRRLVVDILKPQISSSCKFVTPNDLCERAVASRLSSKFNLNESFALAELGETKSLFEWMVRYSSTLRNRSDLKNFFERQLQLGSASSESTVALYSKYRNSFFEIFNAGSRGVDQVNFVVTDSDNSNVVDFVLQVGYAIGSGAEKVAEIPVISDGQVPYVAQVYKYRTNPNYYKVLYKFTDGDKYLFLTSENVGLGYEIAQSVTK